MSHTLTLELPDEIWEPLLRLAEERGSRPEELARQSVARLVAADEDPLDRFIGAIRSGQPGWGQRHDEILGDMLIEELRGVESPDDRPR